MIRILAVADTEDRALYDDYNSERWAKERVELIVSCGDLRPGYLDFLVSVFNVPCFYVRGNHDIAYDDTELGGCVSLHQRVERYKGVTLLAWKAAVGTAAVRPSTPNGRCGGRSSGPVAG